MAKLCEANKVTITLRSLSNGHIRSVVLLALLNYSTEKSIRYETILPKKLYKALWI